MMNTIDLDVQSMSCGSYVNHVTQALKPTIQARMSLRNFLHTEPNCLSSRSVT